ncbi:hypothetical protein OIU76_022635 [Salix suchowensis]|nr:hypothetical protein OIU76_022635 [Salix suchowensis]
MAVAKSNSSRESLKQPCNCYRVSSLTETILDTHQISNLKDRLSGHANVVDLKAVYEDEDYVHLIMELCAGGELFHQLEKHGRFSEAEARDLFRHLMQVVLYCHENGVVHRDLKPENILLATKSSSSPIKLADFGLATYVKPGQSLHGTVGSPFYIAPEVLAGGYNQAADVWSAGVILYILLSGMPPFWAESAKELVKGMLCTDPSQRFTAQQVLDNSWMKYDGPYLEESSQLEKQSREVWDLGSNSFSMLMARDKDVSFGTGSPIIHDVQSPTFTCRSSFSSFLGEPTPSFVSGGFSFRSSDDSNALEFISPVSSMLSFAFSSPGPVIEQGSSALELSSNISRIDSVCGGHQLSEGSLAKMLLLPESSLCCGHEAREIENKPVEVKRAGAEIGSKMLGIHSKRNRTIGLGEREQLDIMVTESIIRWASCTRLPTAPSLRSSLVC